MGGVVSTPLAARSRMKSGVHGRVLKNEVLILALQSVFPLFGPFDVHRYHFQQNRSISTSAASALKFLCFGPNVYISGNEGLYIRVALFGTTF